VWRASSIPLTLAFGEDSCIKRQLNLRLSDGLKLVIIRDFSHFLFADILVRIVC